MGTRHLIAVVKDGDFKVAQYGQWDGNPEWQGAIVVKFLRGIHAEDQVEAFHQAVSRCYFMGRDECEKVNAEFQAQMSKLDKHRLGGYEKYQTQLDESYYQEGSWTHLSRDVGGRILDVVLKRPEEKLGLIDFRGFAGDSLFCEWAYVVDLDNGMFEIYRGLNRTPTPANSRFPSGAEWLEKQTDYEPVLLVATFPLRAIPDDWSEQVLKIAYPENEEDAAA